MTQLGFSANFCGLTPDRSEASSFAENVCGTGVCQSFQGVSENGSPEIRTQDQSVKSHLNFAEIHCRAMGHPQKFLKKFLKSPFFALLNVLQRVGWTVVRRASVAQIPSVSGLR